MIRSIFISFILLCHNALAQSPVVKVEIVTIALEESEKTFFYSSGAEIREFASARTSLSFPVTYQGPLRFILHRTKEAFLPPAEGQKPTPPAAFVDLPKGSSRVLLISAPAPDDGIRLLSYDISNRSMKDGSYRIFNFASKDVAIILGEEKALVPSTGDRILSAPKWSKEILSLPCQIGVVLDDKSVKPAYSSVWGHRPIRRSMLFVFDGKRGKDSVLLRRFYDIIMPEKEEAAASE